MKLQGVFLVGFILSPLTVSGASSVYCPGKQGNITVGMTSSQVINACGQPQSRQDTDVKVAIKIPVTQLIYTTLNEGAVYSGLTSYYSMWSLPSGSTGTSLHVNIINNKVTGLSVNGTSMNAMSICGGNSIQIGDDAENVYSACGSPSLVNETYTNQPVSKKQHPEIWVYQLNEYQPAIRLTFVDGKLQSIQ